MFVLLHHRAKRRIVWVTLVGWVLAMLAGVANACLLQAQGSRAPASAALAHDGSAERGLRAAQALHVKYGDLDRHATQAGDTADPGKAGCLKFCDDESSTVTNGKAAQTDLPGPVLLASVDWHPAVRTAAVATWQPVERPTSQGPPLVIRFLRLTI